MTPYVGRYAPSPTGDLHLGNLLAALVAWARARRAGGRIFLRMEDLDGPRTVPGAATRIAEDLEALGLHFDAGPGHDDDHGPYVQSRCIARYEEALARLRATGRIYPCRCSRKELQRVASAPHLGEEAAVYRGTCLAHPPDPSVDPVSWRFRVDPGEWRVEDRLQGRFSQRVDQAVGDFIVRRKDGVIAYQLAVVVDDLHQGVTEVVRGRDLLESTPRQLQLIAALGAEAPAHAHVPLWLAADGSRLAKRSGAQTLRALRAAGEPPGVTLGRVGRALGVCRAGEAISAAALAARLEDAVLRVPAVCEEGPLPG